GLLSDAQAAMDFIRADAVLRAADHPDSSKPLVEADRRIFHQGAKLDREHFLTGLALPRPTCRNERVLVGLATRTCDLAIRPAKRDHEGKRVIGIGEVYDCLLEGLWKSRLLCLCHNAAIVS